MGLRFIAFGIFWLAVMGFAVYALWNLLLPAILGVRAIDYWQALGLFALSRVLFGRFGWGPLRRGRFVRGWNQLTPEERERFRRAMGHGEPEGGAPLNV